MVHGLLISESAFKGRQTVPLCDVIKHGSGLVKPRFGYKFTRRGLKVEEKHKNAYYAKGLAEVEHIDPLVCVLVV